MNERIRELVAQVEKWIRTTNFEGMPEDEMTYDEIFQKKFAELIVRECIKICSDVESDEELCGLSDGALVCMAEIKEHFGVEE